MNKSVIVELWEKDFDPDVIRTRSLLIWSQTRYRCAMDPCCRKCAATVPDSTVQIQNTEIT